MKDDYLWDKTGNDPEIEKLESTLSVFRYEPIDAPTRIEAKSETPRRRFWDLRFVLAPAFAACVVCAVAAGLWFSRSSDTLVANVEGGLESPQPAENIPAAEAKVYAPSISERAPISSSRNENGGPVIQPVSMSRDRRAIRTKRREPEPKLTREEKYAYNRLMLALSITGSKLRMVQDKVNGLEVENTGSKNDR